MFDLETSGVGGRRTVAFRGGQFERRAFQSWSGPFDLVPRAWGHGLPDLPKPGRSRGHARYRLRRRHRMALIL